MHNLDTYNRVPSLGSTLTKRATLLAYSVSLLAVMVGLIGLLTGQLSWLYAAIVFSVSLIAFIALKALTSRPTKQCQLCQSSLDYVIRPFILSADDLRSNGTKINECFFTYRRWGRLPLKKRWVKISRRSLACHHCRLTENRVTEVLEHPNTLELSDVKAKLGSRL